MRAFLISVSMVFLLGGCALPAIGALTINHMFTAVSLTSTLISGKGLGDHAMDVATGQDCRLLDAALRIERAVCEPMGSEETEKDFKGFRTILAFRLDPVPAPYDFHASSFAEK